MRFVLFAILLSTISAAPVVRVKVCPVVLPTDATPRIVGGNEASPHTRSHVVSFYEEGCGGSLLSDVWVLTAAHCLVHDGSMARIGGSNSSNGVEIPVRRVIDHPDYEFPTNDITLVELESSAPSSARFTAVNSNPSIPEDGEYGRVAGYGFQEEGFDLDHDAMLRQVDVPVMNTQKCIDRYFSVHSYLKDAISATKHICAGYDVGGCDSCTADSGGPLFVYDSQNTPVQIAIVSFGYGCAHEVPGGYTRVSAYVSWMKSVGAVFTEKTARVARFGDSVSRAEGDDPQTEEKEEQIDENITEPRPEETLVPSPPEPSDTASVPLPLEPDTSVPTPDETELAETPSKPQASSKPSPPARLPPNHAVSPPPSEGKPSSSDSQGGHGGEGKPRPETSGSAIEEPLSTRDDEDSESTVSTDGNESDASPSDESSSDTSPSDASPSDASPSDASPSDASPSDASPSYASPGDGNPSDASSGDVIPSDVIPSDVIPSDVIPSDASSGDVIPSDVIPSDVIPSDVIPSDASSGDVIPSDVVPSDAIPDNASQSDASTGDVGSSDAVSAESEEDEPEGPEDLENNPTSSEDEDDGSEDDITGESETSNSGEGAPASGGAGPSNHENNPDIHRPTSPNPEYEQGSEDEQHDQSEKGSANGGGEIDIDGFIEDGNANGTETDTESESNGLGQSETRDPVEVSSAGEIESGSGTPVGPIYSPGPSSGVSVPPSETLSEGFEELEPSGSPEVAESPDALSADAQGGGLGGLPIAMIVIGSVLILAIIGYLIYFILSKMEEE